MIGRSGERGSGISVLAARHDDDDDETSINQIKLFSTEWHINPNGLFDAESSLYIYIKCMIWFSCVLWHINYFK